MFSAVDSGHPNQYALVSWVVLISIFLMMWEAFFICLFATPLSLLLTLSRKVLVPLVKLGCFVLLLCHKLITKTYKVTWSSLGVPKGREIRDIERCVMDTKVYFNGKIEFSIIDSTIGQCET